MKCMKITWQPAKCLAKNIFFTKMFDTVNKLFVFSINKNDPSCTITDYGFLFL